LSFDRFQASAALLEDNGLHLELGRRFRLAGYLLVFFRG